MNLLPGFVGEFRSSFFIQVTADLNRHIIFNFFPVIILDDNMAVVFDVLAIVVFHTRIHIFFRVDKDLLAAFLIFEAYFVVIVRSALLAATRFNGTFGLLIRELVRRHLAGIINAADNNWLIWITL